MSKSTKGKIDMSTSKKKKTKKEKNLEKLKKKGMYMKKGKDTKTKDRDPKGMKEKAGGVMMAKDMKMKMTGVSYGTRSPMTALPAAGIPTDVPVMPVTTPVPTIMGISTQAPVTAPVPTMGTQAPVVLPPPFDLPNCAAYSDAW